MQDTDKAGVEASAFFVRIGGKSGTAQNTPVTPFSQL